MNDKTPKPLEEQSAEIGKTRTKLPASSDPLFSRLEYIAGLLADADKLPCEPLLVWREENGALRHATARPKIVVGRHPDQSSIALPEDELLSRAHFAVEAAGEDFRLEDLNSRNGTAVNEPSNRIRTRLLRDGDLILAGQHVFAFLDQRRRN